VAGSLHPPVTRKPVATNNINIETIFPCIKTPIIKQDGYLAKFNIKK
jgi:hypothetical protein